jgi:hypothetical protein
MHTFVFKQVKSYVAQASLSGVSFWDLFGGLIKKEFQKKNSSRVKKDRG